jgi:hypothetical protein
MNTIYLSERSREWEEKEKVLGHLERSDFRKPRAVLSIPSAAYDLDDEEGGEEEEENEGYDDTSSMNAFRLPFATRLWGMRLAVQRGHEALYTVQEIQHLLSQPMISNDPLVNTTYNKYF